MKIILASIGTLGDIEPFLAIGKILKNQKDIMLSVHFQKNFEK